jgi:hypothetical protein
VLKLLVLVEKLDWNVAIFFLQDGCATLIEGLDLVDDYIIQSAVDLVMTATTFGGSGVVR